MGTISKCLESWLIKNKQLIKNQDNIYWHAPWKVHVVHFLNLIQAKLANHKYYNLIEVYLQKINMKDFFTLSLFSLFFFFFFPGKKAVADSKY